MSNPNEEDVDLNSIAIPKAHAGDAQAASGHDDWEDVPMHPRDKYTPVESALIGAGSGATFGFGDEIAGAAKGAYDVATDPDKKLSFDDFNQARKQHTDKFREYLKNAEADNPKSYLGGNVAGSIGSGFFGGAALGLGGKAIQGGRALGAAAETLPGFLGTTGGAVARVGVPLAADAAGGALAAAGESNNAFGTKKFADDLEEGGVLGAVVPKAIKGVMSVGKAIPKALLNTLPEKAAKVFLGAPEEATRRYMTRPDAVNAAPSKETLVRNYNETLDALKREVGEGSSASRKILDDEGVKFSGQDISKIPGDMADQIEKRLAGINDDPQTSNTLKMLRDRQQAYQPTLPEGVEGPLMSKEISGSRLKDSIQGIDKNTDWDVGAGQFGRTDDNVRKDLRKGFDTLLKEKSPAYAGQMESVAKDTDLLSRASSGFNTDQGLSKRFDQVAKDKNFSAVNDVKDLDSRMGTNFYDQSKDLFTKEAFDKASPNGSRRVNLGKALGENAGPFGKALGAITGATVDQYGPAMTKGLVDVASKIQRTLSSSEGMQKLGKFGTILQNAAEKGVPELTATYQLLRERHPEIEDAIK